MPLEMKFRLFDPEKEVISKAGDPDIILPTIHERYIRKVAESKGLVEEGDSVECQLNKLAIHIRIGPERLRRGLVDLMIIQLIEIIECQLPVFSTQEDTINYLVEQLEV